MRRGAKGQGMTEGPLPVPFADLPAFPIWPARNKAEADRLGAMLWTLYPQISGYEAQLNPASKVLGYSAPAGSLVEFAMAWNSEGGANWRETVVCPVTGLSNRARAAFHLFAVESRLGGDANIYITEQTTAFYRYLKSIFPSLVGSEFIPGALPGMTTDAGIRHEDLTALSFREASLDAILSFDVLEHVPDYQAGLRECARVLRPGGRIYITVPFVGTAETIVRARVLPDGEIEHLLPAEYHGDPMVKDGILCFYHFGYDVLDVMRRVGFSDAWAGYYWSAEFGYLGVMQVMIVGVR